QSLASAVRARAEIRSLRAAAVERREDRLRLIGGLVYRAIAEIDHLLRMVERPGGVGCAGLVSRVGGRGGVPVSHRVRQIAQADRAGKATVADAQQLSIPA